MEQQILIRTQWGCAVVVRAHHMPDGPVVYERAANATELALAALAAIVAQGGIRWVDGQYECPPELAAKARWASEQALMVAA